MGLQMNSVRDFDRRLTKVIQELPKSVKQLMVSVSFLGEPLFILAVAFGGFLSATIRHQYAIQRAFIYATLAFILCILLKLALRRTRPHHLDIRTFGVRSYSFPSGHAFGAVIFFGLFSYLDLVYLSKPWNIILSVFLWVLIAVIGISRIYLKAHYPSDVAGGWLLGLLSLMLVIKLAF